MFKKFFAATMGILTACFLFGATLSIVCGCLDIIFGY